MPVRTHLTLFVLCCLFVLLQSGKVYAAPCATPQASDQVPAEVQSLAAKNGTTTYFIPTGMGASSIYYKVTRMNATCQQTPLAAQEWDGQNIILSKPTDDDTLSCVDLKIDAKTGIIRCDINSGAALTEELNYHVVGDQLELLDQTDTQYIDAKHSKRKTVYRNAHPHA